GVCCALHSSSVYDLVLVASVRCVGSFFLHAEDGIRDSRVTGVQTCALPISHTHTHTLTHTPSISLSLRAEGMSGRRSEERRGGKECSSRWCAYHSQKQT